MLRSSVVILSALSTFPLMGVRVSNVMDPGVELSLSTDKKAYVAYEPVVATFTLRNTADQDVNIGGLSFGSGTIRLEIADVEKIYRPYASGLEHLTTGAARRLLPPGVAFTSELIVLTNSLGVSAVANPGLYPGVVPFPFSRPGKYSLRASLWLEPGIRVSRYSVVEITVEAGNSAAGPLEFFPSIEDYASAMGGDYYSDLSTEAFRRWESFVQTNPRGVFAPFVARQLGIMYLHGTGLPAPDPVRAVELFTFAARTAPRPLRNECLVWLAEAQITAGNPMAAGKTVDRVLKTKPHSGTSERARRIRNGLNSGLRTVESIYSR